MYASLEAKVIQFSVRKKVFVMILLFLRSSGVIISKIGSKIAKVETFLQLETTFFIIKFLNKNIIMFLNLYHLVHANGR